MPRTPMTVNDFENAFLVLNIAVKRNPPDDTVKIRASLSARQNEIGF